MIRSLHRRLLGIEPHPELTGRDAANVMLRVAVNGLRAWRWRPFLARCGGQLLVARGVRVLNPAQLSVGRRVKLEENVELQARSRRGVRLGDGVTVGRGASIRPSSYYGHEPGEGLEVGDGTAIGAGSWIGASGFVSIGCDVLFGPGVVVLPENHLFDDPDATIKSQGVERAGVVVEDDCWIGARAVLLAGVRVGRGAVVAAGAVVTRDVAPNAVVGGVPARVLRMRGARRSEAA